MKKIDFPGIIVMEGQSDRAFLQGFVNAEIVITNGSSIPRETIDYLVKASVDRDIVILTDPDFPGQKIRNELSAVLPNAKHAFVEREKCIGKHKLGIAESDRDSVLAALENILSKGEPGTSDVTYGDLLERGLVGTPSSSLLRQKLMEKLGLGYGNGKTLLSRCAYGGITLKQIDEALDELR